MCVCVCVRMEGTRDLLWTGSHPEEVAKLLVALCPVENLE